MATAYGNQVQRWRAKVVASVVSTTDTTARVRVQAYWCSVAWGYSVYNSRGGACIGGACTYATFTASSATGETREILVATREQTFNRGDAASSVACKATVTLSGGYHDGTSTASVSVTIPAIAYHVPSPPTGASASRASDSQAKVSWTNHPSGTTGKYTGLAIERQTDGGSWVQLATLGATVANYTDNGLSANHRYRWRVRAKNNAGWSTYATTGYVYTTPAAPTAVTLSKTDETTVAVSITGAAPWATSYEVQWHEVETRKHKMLFENKTLEVWSVPLRHRIPAAGFLFREKAPALNLHKEAVARYGLGIAQCRAAKRGEDVVLADGTVVPNAELTYRPYRERSFAYLSDTLYSHRAAELVSGVDLLYHEATFADEDRTLAKKTGHSTAKQAAQAALAAGAGRLLIGHFSSRYKDLRQLEEEAREVFPRSEAVIEGRSYEIPCNR